MLSRPPGFEGVDAHTYPPCFYVVNVDRSLFFFRTILYLRNPTLARFAVIFIVTISVMLTYHDL